MTRDYKNAGRSKKKSKGAPGWVWLLTGLAIGLLVAFLVYLNEQRPDKAISTASTTSPAKSTPPKKKTSASPGNNKNTGLRYEFYTLLPESEVVIPEHELAERNKENAATTIKARNYVLQAGSFRRQSEAESLKARLALLGIESSIQSVNVNNDTWHRVRVGSFTSLRDINETRNRLRNNNINAILVKVKG